MNVSNRTKFGPTKVNKAHGSLGKGKINMSQSNVDCDFLPLYAMI